MPPHIGDDILNVKELTPYVRQSLKKTIEIEGFVSYNVDVQDVSTDGGNYMATLQSVSIQGKCKNGEEKVLNLFLKNIIPSDKPTVVDGAEVYLREGYVYNDLFKVIEKLEDEFKIPQKDRFNVVKSFGEINDKVIILEDASKMEFKTNDSTDVVSLKFAELSIEQIAKLHALSFAIQKERPEYFENNIKKLNSLFILDDNFTMHLRKSCNKAMETLDADAKTKLDNYFPKIIENYTKYLIVPVDEAVGLVHGDFRPNNILVKEMDGEISKVIPIDYQVTCYGYPVTDFIYFIFVSTDQTFRKNHLENLKDLYYSTFENFLSKFNIEAKEVYSRKQFEQDYKDKLDYGLMSFLTAMPFLFPKRDNIPDLTSGLQNTTFDMDESYKDRLHGIVDDFIQWGYL